MPRYNAVAFSINGKGYVGTGHTSDNQFLKDFWEYTPQTDEWRRIDDFPGDPRTEAVAFAIGNNGYVGLGTNYPSDDRNHFKDFYKYSGQTNQWVRITDFGGIGRYSAASFTLGNIGYVGTGYCGPDLVGNLADDVWAYNPNNSTWTKDSDFSNRTSYAVGFNIENQGYLYDFSQLYKLESGLWVEIPSVSLFTSDNIAFSIGQSGYFGLGIESQALGSYELYGYNSVTADVVNYLIPQARYGAVVFTIYNKAYIVGGITYNTVLNDVWEFDPNKP